MFNLKAKVDAFDSLDNCAVWPFENYMQQLKKSRGGNNPAARFVKRALESMEMDTIPDKKKARKIIRKKPNNVYQIRWGKYCEVIQPVNGYQRVFLCRVNHSSKYSFTYPCISGIFGNAQFAKQRYTIRRIEAGEQMTRCMNFSFLPCQQN